MKSKLIKSDYTEILFNNIQHKIANIPLLHHPDMRRNAEPFLIKCDTSLYQIGASLWQSRGKEYVLLKLASRALSPQQQRYSATERECFGYVTMII